MNYKYVIWAFVVLVLAGGAVGLLRGRRSHPGKTSEATVTIRLAYRPQALADVTPVVIQEERLSAPGVHVVLVPVPDAATAFQKFSAGEVDAMAGMTLQSVLEQLRAPTGHRRFIAYYHQLDVAGQGWVSLVGSRGITSIQGLAGKPVASLPTDQAKWLLRRILLAAGLTGDQVKITQYNPATPTAALASGSAAGLFGLEPAVTKAVADGGVVLARGPISHFLYGDKPVVVSVSVVDAQLVNEHALALSSFLALVDQAVRFTDEHPDEVRALFTKRDYGELAPDVATRLFLPVMARPDPRNRPVLEQFVSDAVRDGVLAGPVDLGPLFPEQVNQP